MASRWGEGLWDGCALALMPLGLILCAVSRVEQGALLSFAIVLIGVGMMLFGWERTPRNRELLMPVVVLGALAAAGRLIFAAIPSVQPVTAICIIGGIAFGRRSGFMVGALAALASNCFLGQGLWTPWQMYAWGLAGYGAGALFSGRTGSLVAVCAYGFVASFAFGLIMNTWSLVGFVHPLTVEAALLTYGASLIFDGAHGISTVAFLIALYGPWRKKLQRIKEKFGLFSEEKGQGRGELSSVLSK